MSEEAYGVADSHCIIEADNVCQACSDSDAFRRNRRTTIGELLLCGTHRLRNINLFKCQCIAHAIHLPFQMLGQLHQPVRCYLSCFW